MVKIKKIFILVLISFFIIITLFTTTYATSVKVTDDNLKASLQKFISSSNNDKNYQIAVENNQIKITSDDGNYILSYDLTNKPTFTYETEVKQGMSYNEFQEKTGGSILTMLGYMAVADIQGVDYEDSLAYFLMYLLSNSFSSLSNTGTYNSYVIIDDINGEEGDTIDKDTTNNKIIYASDFVNRVMEYVNEIYKEKQTIKDTNGLNTFEMTSEKKDTTSTSCKLLTTLTVNTDADFSKIKGYTNSMGESFMNKDITKDNADYSITLKVGQKCRVESTEKITGSYCYGCGYEEVDDYHAEITGIIVGKATGYIEVGDIKKTFYITVEQNAENKTLDAIVLKIDTSQNSNPINNNENNVTNVSVNNNENKIANVSVMPRTGEVKNPFLIILYILIASAIIGIATLILTRKKV